MESQPIEVQLQSKSVLVAAVLTFFLGGFGLFYNSLLLGLLGAAVELFLVVIWLVTLGIGGFLLPPWHVVCIVIAVLQATAHNRRLLRNYMNRNTLY
ncbi:MAG: hypothetical protein LIP77_01835 [Planctomycetes bacterium]|nr:hypothetical protein [Planctomycetota bacterium]